MASWQNLVIPASLRHKVLQIAQAVYEHAECVDIPSSFDPWWYNPSLSYQVQGDSPQPSIVILNLREGLAEDPIMNTHFMINMNTFNIHDKFQNERFPVPQEVAEHLQELRQYVVDHVRRKKEEGDARRAREALEKKKEEERRVKQVEVRVFLISSTYRT
jgi:hypothetical protein